MEVHKTLLIINPISGTSSKRGLENVVSERLTPCGFNVDVAVTKARGDATSLATGAVMAGYDTVIAAGGDGTVNETAIALRGTGVALGIIPCGSGNGLARHLDIPIDISASLSVIAKNNVVECDCGSVNGRPFFCTFGVGFDAAVSEKFSRDKRRGKLSYLRSAFNEWLSYNPEEYVISANGVVLTERAFLVAVCNASQYGNNAYIAPEASLTDGLLDVTIIHSGTPLTTALVGVDLMTGYINRNTLIHTFRTSHAVIERKQPGPSHIDGEPVMLANVMSVDCHRNALKIYASGPNEPSFKPIITPVRSMMRDLRYAISNIFQKV